MPGRSIAWASSGTALRFPKAIEALREGLRDKGWVEGQNLSFEPLWTEGHFERIDALAEQLVRSKVDVIVAPSSIYTGAAQRATSTIPIVFVSHADPLGSGHVASLSCPGGNITGLSLLMTETNAKSLETLKEALPSVSQVAVIYDPATPSHAPGLKTHPGGWPHRSPVSNPRARPVGFRVRGCVRTDRATALRCCVGPSDASLHGFDEVAG